MNIFLSIIVAICFLCVLYALIVFIKEHPYLALIITIVVVILLWIYSELQKGVIQ